MFTYKLWKTKTLTNQTTMLKNNSFIRCIVWQLRARSYGWIVYWWEIDIIGYPTLVTIRSFTSLKIAGYVLDALAIDATAWARNQEYNLFAFQLLQILLS